jgi:WD40 repeat protein
LATGNHDKSVRIWDATSGEQLFVLSGHAGTVWSVSFSPDGKRVASGGSDGAVKIWNIDPQTPTPDRGQVIHNLVGHTSGVQSLRFHPDGTRLASGCAGGTVKVWDAIHGQRPLELKVLSQRKVRLSFRPDSTHLAVTDNRQVKIWDVKKDEITTTLTDRLENEPK